mmetsp:Transcript_44019/g.73103  ORF Transcript_44019/g.73103 Transcript_44019/m.73103 type:complete len:121 (+) Transcript_44019:90-452(+)
MAGAAAPCEITQDVIDAAGAVRDDALLQYTQKLIHDPRDKADVSLAYAGSPAFFKMWQIESAMKQVVAGTNYFIKVRISDSEHIRLRIYQSLPHAGGKCQLSGMLWGEQASKEVAYFEPT